MTRLHCAIIGAGIIGLSTAWRLAVRGARITVYDSHAQGHSQGSSHGPSRLFRIAYYEKPDYTPLAIKSASLWRELESFAGAGLFNQCGVLFYGPPEGFLVGGARHAAQVHSLSLRSLNAVQTAASFPWLQARKDFEAVIEEDAGYIFAERAIEHLRHKLAAYGAEFCHQESVQHWSDAPNGVILESDRRTAKFDHAVAAAGVWSTSLLGAAAPVAPVSKSLFWLGGRNESPTLESGLRPFAVETSDARMFYGFPALDSDGFKIGEHTGGQSIHTLEDRPREADPRERGDLLAFRDNYAPGLPRTITRESMCLYEMSPDGHFLIGRHPVCEHLSFAAGLSGHGFKFAPIIGEAMAALAYGEPLGPEFQFLAPSRFHT